MLQQLPSSAESYAVDQRAEITAAARAASKLWRGMGQDFDASYSAIEPSLLRVADLAQSRVLEGAQAYIPAVLAQTGQVASIAPRFTVDAYSLVGTAGDGLPTEGLLYGAVTHAKASVGSGATVAEALVSGGQWLSTAMGTLLSDTGRASESLAMQSRHVAGYVRMLTPPSCGRCAVLAGKWTRAQVAFQRHPGCDCRNIPASESVGGDMTVDVNSYFDSLDEAGQIRLMGSKSNAEAVREFGADPTQVINAYRDSWGVRPAQVYGRTVKYTTEGTTRRGLAYKSMSRADYVKAAGAAKNGRYTQLRAPRLMPESIAQIAKDRVDQERLLRLYGWVL